MRFWLRCEVLRKLLVERQKTTSETDLRFNQRFANCEAVSIFLRFSYPKYFANGEVAERIGSFIYAVLALMVLYILRLTE